MTGDALLTQRDVGIRIVAGGGAYVLSVDANQPALLAAVEAAFSPLDGDGPGRVGDANDRPVADRRIGPTRRGDDGGDNR